MLGFLFVVNDNLFVDVENPKTLQCIIYRIEQTNVLNLCQRSTLWKGLIKNNKFNGIIPMKNHIEFAHPGLVASRELAINVKKVNTFA